MKIPTGISGVRSRLAASLQARNVVSNYGAVAWNSLLSIIAIPICYRLLGRAEWGLVAAATTIQGFLNFMDAGFGQIMPRDIARVAGDICAETRLFKCFSSIYALLAVTGFAIAQFGAHPFAVFWLKAPVEHLRELEWALRLVGLQFLFQFFNNANYGYWSGVEAQTLANLRQSGFATLKQLAGIASLVIVAPNAVAYIAPFCIISLCEVVSNRAAIAKTLNLHSSVGASWKEIGAVAHEASGLTVGVLVGILVSQLDRIILSNSVSISDYGTYVIVANVALAFMQLHYPVVRAYFPKIVQQGKRAGITGASRRMLQFVVLLCVIPSLLMALFGRPLLYGWIHSALVVNAGMGPLRLILVAVCLNAIYQVFYQRIVAFSDSRLIIGINVAALLVAGLIGLKFRHRMGIGLGGLIWVGSCGTQLLAGITWWLIYEAKSSRVIELKCNAEDPKVLFNDK